MDKVNEVEKNLKRHYLSQLEEEYKNYREALSILKDRLSPTLDSGNNDLIDNQAEHGFRMNLFYDLLGQLDYDIYQAIHQLDVDEDSD